MPGKLFSLLISICYFSGKLFSQSIIDTITRDRVEKNISYLASDKLKGRVNYTKEQLEAADFISNEFKSYGLDPFPGSENFYQPFRTSFGNGAKAEEIKWNGEKLNDSLYYFFSSSLSAEPMDLSDFFILQAFPPVADSILFYNWQRTENLVVWIVLSDSISFSEVIKRILIPAGMPSSNILLVGKKTVPETLKVIPNKNMLNADLYNIVGMIPGRSRANEAIIFSAHYDHVDHGQYGETGGIYNGANDDASGTTAVLELARYFALRNDNERTILFCLFAGEELGLLGSRAFVNSVKFETIKAVINIEMIGISNIAGKNAFMLTGSWYSDLYQILDKNLEGEKVKVVEQKSDPANLFGRSDNYPFAREGIPAHTVMCSDDKDPCYHKPCDDVKRIDIDNMTRIIKAIAKSAETLISGKDTPTRLKGL